MPLIKVDRDYSRQEEPTPAQQCGDPRSRLNDVVSENGIIKASLWTPMIPMTFTRVAGRRSEDSQPLPSEGWVGHGADAQTFTSVLFVCVYVCQTIFMPLRSWANTTWDSHMSTFVSQCGGANALRAERVFVFSTSSLMGPVPHPPLIKPFLRASQQKIPQLHFGDSVCQTVKMLQHGALFFHTFLSKQAGWRIQTPGKKTQLIFLFQRHRQEKNRHGDIQRQNNYWN